MSKLDSAIAKALGLQTEIRGKRGAETVWVKHKDRVFVPLKGYGVLIADWIIRSYDIVLIRQPSGEWMGECGGCLAYHKWGNRAALMAFCKHKGVAYE